MDETNGGAPGDAARTAALREASIPTLLMCVAQITGDARWLRAPFLPQRDVSIFADPTGGLPPAVQDEVRAAAARLLDELARGERTLPPLPDDATLVEMMSTCLGERMPAEYAALAREEMGFADREVRHDPPPPSAAMARMRTLVVGAGLSGLCAAWRLRALGVPVEIVEKNDDVGGTWWDNDYPEAGVDTPNHFYSYSFAPNLGWTSNYSKRAEVLEYLKRTADGLGVLRTVRLRTEVLALEWHEAARVWAATIRDDRGERVERYRAVVLACGPLSRPRLSAVPGIEGFSGDWFHTSHWRGDVPLEGRDVALIGTGASAMQCLRTVASTARSVTVWQRSPQWARPPQDYHGTVSDGQRWLLEHVPYYYAWYRFGLMWRFGDGLLPTLVRDPDWPHPGRAMNARNDRHREQLAAYMREKLAGRDDLVGKAMPAYPPYGKRILIDNGWFDALRRDNVELVTEAVARVEGDEVVGADGTRRRADVAILATGFEASRMLGPMAVTGRDGATIEREWANDDPKAHLGIVVPGFPNLFLLVGPGTGLAHGGSIFLVTECQVRWISKVLLGMAERGLDAVDVRRDVHDAFVARFDAAHRDLVWSHPGMRNWYRNEAGRVFVPMPWRMVDYWRMTFEPDFAEFCATPAAVPA